MSAMSDFVLPPALEPGDDVAIVAPGTSHATLFPHAYELGLDRLESEFDVNPVEFPTATKSPESKRITFEY